MPLVDPHDRLLQNGKALVAHCPPCTCQATMNVLSDISPCFCAAARAAVAQAATAVSNDRAARLGLATPAPTAVPAVVAQAGPDVMVPAMAPEAAMGMMMAPQAAMGVAQAPAVSAQQGPTAMDAMTPAMAPGDSTLLKQH